MQHPWEVRSRKDIGDPTPEMIFVKVGAALTHWEGLESIMAELFDTLVANYPTNRAAFAAYSSVKSSSARTELIEAAAERAISDWDPIKVELTGLITAVGKSGARRNEIAHGRVYNFDEFGFFLGPNNIMPYKWKADGAAKFQYCAADIEHYANFFSALKDQCEALVDRIRSRSTKIKQAKSRLTDLDRRS